MTEILNFIDGRWEGAGATLENFEPATGKVYSSVPDSGEAEVGRAVEAARRAFPAWAALSAEERSSWLRKLADGIRAELPELARAESVDNGKPLALARELDIPRSARNLEFFADAATQFATECHAMGGAALNYTLREPLGVVGCISPWNLPLYLLTWKIAPALAAGNCVVAKPSEVTPMTAYLLSRICEKVGLPRGVLNVVHGTGARAGHALTRHPGIRAISFTGSTATGGAIAREAAGSFKKVSLEMGGKNPLLVFADADFEKASAAALRAGFANQGEICLCGSRVFVERRIYERFRDKMVAGARELRVGDPLEAGTDQGALVSRAHYEKVLSCIERARSEGGRVLCGGKPARVEGRCRDGWFVEPTLIEGLAQSCVTNQEEIFGPVATLIPFDSEEEVLRGANDVRYGLAASVWTTDLSRAHRVAAAIQAGIVWVNTWMLRDLRTPFGGMKQSGVGREGGWEAMRFFTESKNVCIQFGESG